MIDPETPPATAWAAHPTNKFASTGILVWVVPLQQFCKSDPLNDDAAAVAIGVARQVEQSLKNLNMLNLYWLVPVGF